MTLEIILILCLSLASLIYSIFAFNQKGPLLISGYFSSKEDYEKAKTKKMYRHISSIYFFLSMILGIYALCEINNYENSGAVIMLLLLAFIIYCFVSIMVNPFMSDK